MFNLPNPDGYLSASDVKDVAEEFIAPLPLPGVEGSPLDRVDNYPFEIELLLADSGLYNERVIRRAREIAATVVHVRKKVSA